MKPLADLINFGVDEFLDKFKDPTNEVTEEEIEKLKLLQNRADNAVELLQDALPKLGAIIWISVSENESGCIEPDTVKEIGVLIEILGDAISAAIRVESNASYMLREVEALKIRGARG